AAEQAARRTAELVTQVDAALPELSAADAACRQARAALADRDAQLALLVAVSVPPEAATLARAAAAARAALTTAGAAVDAAEDAEGKLRAELAAAGNPDRLRELLRDHERRAQLATQREQLAAEATRARADRDRAATALAEAKRAAAEAD